MNAGPQDPTTTMRVVAVVERVTGCGLPDRAKAAGAPPAGARVVDDSPCPPGHNTPLPLERSPPGSFKRLLGRPSIDRIADESKCPGGGQNAPSGNEKDNQLIGNRDLAIAARIETTGWIVPTRMKGTRPFWPMPGKNVAAID